MSIRTPGQMVLERRWILYVLHVIAWGQGLTLSLIQMNVTLIYDEFTDTLSGEEASKAANIIHRTLNDRDYDDGSWICQLMKEYVYLEVLLFTH